jgi:hypothetical protein
VNGRPSAISTPKSANRFPETISPLTHSETPVLVRANACDELNAAMVSNTPADCSRRWTNAGYEKSRAVSVSRCFSSSTRRSAPSTGRLLSRIAFARVNSRMLRPRPIVSDSMPAAAISG